MEIEKFRFYSIIIIAFTVFIIGLSVLVEETRIAVFAVLAAMLLMYILKGRVREVTEDERNYIISEKASRRTVQAVIASTAILSCVFFILYKTGYPQLEGIGVTMAFVGIAALILYLVFFGYYSKKYGA